MSNPPFIAEQRLFRLNLPWRSGEQKDWPSDALVQKRLERSADDDEGQSAEKRGWIQVENRQEFLTDPSIKRLCVVEDAGMGKTKLLEQIQYLRQADDPGLLAIRFEFHELPENARDYLAGPCPRLIERLHKYLPGVPETDAVDRGLERLIQRKIRQGKLTLIVDALDQSNSAEAREKMVTALRDFLTKNPDVRCVISGRQFAVQRFWPKLFKETGPWDLVQIDSFTDEERKTFLGDERSNKLQQLEADVLAIPRALETVRDIPEDELNVVRTASDLYWRCVNRMLQRGLRQQSIRIGFEQALSLFALLAFETVRRSLLAGVENQPTTLDGVECREFVRQVWQARKDAELNEYVDCQRPFDEFCRDLGRLVALNLHLDPGVLEAGGDDPYAPELTQIVWRNRTLQDFFAALWVTRYSQSDADREWLRTHLHLRGEWSNHHAHPELHEFWRMAAEMPADARSDAVWVRSLSVLYLPPPADKPVVRSTEMVYRSWRCLLKIAGELSEENGSESVVQDVTTDLQFQIRDVVDSGDALPVEIDWMASALMVAQQILSLFLSEFPRMVRESSADSVLCRFDRDLPEGDREGLMAIPAGEFWMGKTESSVSLGFLMSGCAVTNAIYRLFDPGHHGERFSSYEDYSPEPDCPAIYLNWYDGWCVSLWLHGRLPSEHEWEYACRGQLGTDEPPTKWCFGDDESQLAEYAWYETNSERKTHAVGGLRANGIGLSDMHGNVVEWTSSWHHLDPEEGRRPNFVSRFRVLRGGSFLNYSSFCRSAFRLNWVHPSDSGHYFGVRVARALRENLSS